MESYITVRVWISRFAVSLLALTLGSVFIPPVSEASINVQTLHPSTNSTYVLTEDAFVTPAPSETWTQQRLYLSVLYDFYNNPLTAFNPARTQQTTIIDGVNTLNIDFGAYWTKRVETVLDIPLNLIRQENESNNFGVGDMRLIGKIRLTNDGAALAVSVAPEILLPTGDRTLFLSNGSWGLGAVFAFERDFGLLRASANIGYRHADAAKYQDVDYTNQLPLSLGIYFPLPAKFGLNAEINGSLSLPIDKHNNPSELYLGGRYQITREVYALAGASIGSFTGEGGGNFRVVAGLKFTPFVSDVLGESQAKAVAPPPVAPVVAPKAPVQPVKVQPKPKPSPVPSKAKVKPKTKPAKPAAKAPGKTPKPKPSKATPQVTKKPDVNVNVTITH